MKIDPVDPERIFLKLKKKLRKVKYIALSASLPSGLSNNVNSEQTLPNKLFCYMNII